MSLKTTSSERKNFKELESLAYGVNKLKICVLSEDNRGLVMTCSVKAGENVLFIPKNNLIHLKRIETEYSDSLASKIRTSSYFAETLYESVAEEEKLGKK